MSETDFDAEALGVELRAAWRTDDNEASMIGYVVRQAYARGVAAERERCAKLIEGQADNYPAEVFPETSTGRDAISGSMARHCARVWAEDIRGGEQR
jgi:hypothetical protein